MPTPPKDWSPRGDPASGDRFSSVAERILRELEDTNQSEAAAIADTLRGVLDEGELDFDMAEAMLEEFMNAAKWARERFRAARRRWRAT